MKRACFALAVALVAAVLAGCGKDTPATTDEKFDPGKAKSGTAPPPPAPPPLPSKG